MGIVLLDILPLWGIRDPFSTASHAAGALLGLGGLLLLFRRGRMNGLHPSDIQRLVVYGLSTFLVFLASAVFHWTPEELVILKKLDHAAIFLVIAGTCTVIYGSLLDRWSGPLIAGVWIVAVAAIVMKVFVWPMPLWLTSASYVTVGSLAGVGIIPVIRSVPPPALRLLLGGIALLVAGAVIFAAEQPIVWQGVIEAHEVFHVIVLIAAGLHFAFILRHCTDGQEG